MPWPINPFLFGQQLGNDYALGNDLPSQGGLTGNMTFGMMPDAFPGVNPPMNPTPDMNMPDVYSGVIPPQPDFQQLRMQQLFTPEHMAQDRVSELLSQLPERQNPSIFNRIVAALAGGAGGPRSAEQVLDMPYNRAIEDWKDKFQPAYQAANLERYSNATERQAAQNQLQFETGQRRLDITQNKNEADVKIKEEKNEIARARAAAYNWKIYHPNHIIKQDDNGYIIGVDPQSNIAEYVTDAEGNPFKGDKLPQSEYLKINHGYRMQEIGARGDTQIRVENTREGNREKLEGVKQDNRVELKGIPGTSKTPINKPPTPFAIKQNRVNSALAVLAEHPEWADNIHINPGGIVTLDEPESGGWFSSGHWTPQNRAAAKQAIFGNESEDAQSPTTAPPNKPGGAPIKLPPPIEQRKEGLTWTFPNGKSGVWHKFPDGHYGWAMSGGK